MEPPRLVRARPGREKRVHRQRHLRLQARGVEPGASRRERRRRRSVIVVVARAATAGEEHAAPRNIQAAGGETAVERRERVGPPARSSGSAFLDLSTYETRRCRSSAKWMAAASNRAHTSGPYSKCRTPAPAARPRRSRPTKSTRSSLASTCVRTARAAPASRRRSGRGAAAGRAPSEPGHPGGEGAAICKEVPERARQDIANPAGLGEVQGRDVADRVLELAVGTGLSTLRPPRPLGPVRPCRTSRRPGPPSPIRNRSQASAAAWRPSPAETARGHLWSCHGVRTRRGFSRPSAPSRPPAAPRARTPPQGCRRTPLPTRSQFHRAHAALVGGVHAGPVRHRPPPARGSHSRQARTRRGRATAAG